MTDDALRNEHWFDEINHQAATNINEWGEQETETLLLAMQEELGELTQAHLEYNWEDGDEYEVPSELVDLMALGVQLHYKIIGAYDNDSV